MPVAAAKAYSGDLAFFEQLGDTLVINGGPTVDAGLLGLLAEIGLTVDLGFDASGLSDSERSALARADTDGEAMLAAKHDSPGDERTSNWLPAPDAPFSMLLRMHLPEIDALNGHYALPGVEQAQ